MRYSLLIHGQGHMLYYKNKKQKYTRFTSLHFLNISECLQPATEKDELQQLQEWVAQLQTFNGDTKKAKSAMGEAGKQCLFFNFDTVLNSSQTCRLVVRLVAANMEYLIAYQGQSYFPALNMSSGDSTRTIYIRYEIYTFIQS